MSTSTDRSRRRPGSETIKLALAVLDQILCRSVMQRPIDVDNRLEVHTLFHWQNTAGLSYLPILNPGNVLMAFHMESLQTSGIDGEWSYLSDNKYTRQKNDIQFCLTFDRRHNSDSIEDVT